MSIERELLLQSANILSDFKNFEQFAEKIYKLLAQPEQGPVGIVRTIGGYPDQSEHTVELICRHGDLRDGDLLYTAPPKREPLNIEEIHNGLDGNNGYDDRFVDGVRFAEKAHGIRGGK